MDPITIAALSLGLVSMAGNLFGAAQQAKAEELQGEYSKTMARINVKFADFQAKQIVRAGEGEAGKILGESAKIRGAQRAALAAQGINPDSGSAAEIQGDSMEAAARDAVTTQNNAWMEAFGLKQQARGAMNEATLGAAAGRSRAGTTRLTGGLQAINTGVNLADRYYGKG